jgi:hypothetical protein
LVYFRCTKFDIDARAVTGADRYVVADEPAAAADPDRWPARETRAVLLATARGRTSDAESVRCDPAAVDGDIGAGRVKEVLVAANADGHRAGGEEVSEKSAANVVTLVREDANGLSWGLVRTIRTEDWRRTGLISSDARSLGSKMETPD